MEFAVALSEFLDDKAGVIFRRFNEYPLKWNDDFSMFLFGNDLRTRNLKFVSFAAQAFNQDSEMQFAATGHNPALRAVFYFEGQVRLQLFHEAFANLS